MFMNNTAFAFRGMQHQLQPPVLQLLHSWCSSQLRQRGYPQKEDPELKSLLDLSIEEVMELPATVYPNEQWHLLFPSLSPFLVL